MTQEAVAEKLGVEQTTISRYEIGQLAVPVERLIALLDLYGVPSEERAAFLVADEPASIEAA
jgi:transcriptional regulator with XRE-family HTH domain